MDKLQPILKHHFWILLVPLLSLTIWGYMSANSALRAATSTREGELSKALSGIPKGTEDPNSQYVDGLKKQNELYDKYVKEELAALWERQLPRMVWPEIVKPGIPAKHRDPIANQIRENYRNEYTQMVADLHYSVEPFIADKARVTWVEKIDFPLTLIPLPPNRWRRPPAAEEVWDAQEDVWLTRLILEAIRDMNKDADSAHSAVVRKVIKFQLLGGNGESTVGGGPVAAADGESEGDSGSSAYSGGPEGGMMGMMGGGRGGAAAGGAVRFDPQEEFGTGGIAAAGGGMGMGMMMQGSSGSTAAEEGSDAGAPADTGILRFVNQKEGSPFVERGFYLSVIIHQTKMVEFLVRLQNSDWPIKIVRFHFGKNPNASDPFGAQKGAGATGGRDPMGGMMGMMQGGNAGALGAEPEYANQGSPYGDQDAMLGGALPGAAGGGRAAGGGSTGYPNSALQNSDLIQLDLAGLITMYRQPVAEDAAETPTEKPTAEEGMAPEASAPSADGAPDEGTPAPAEAPAEGTPAPGVAAPGEAAPVAEPAAGTEPAASTEPAPEAAPPASPAPADAAPPAPAEPPTEAPAAEAPAAETPPETKPAP